MYLSVCLQEVEVCHEGGSGLDDEDDKNDHPLMLEGEKRRKRRVALLARPLENVWEKMLANRGSSS